MPDPVRGESADGLAAARLASHGVSDTFVALLQGLAEQTRSDGQSRFGRGAVGALRRALLCRNYAGLTLELGHLLELLGRAAPNDNQIALRLFWIDEITSPAALRARLESGQPGLPEGASLSDDRLLLGETQANFELNLHRLPV